MLNISKIQSSGTILCIYARDCSSKERKHDIYLNLSCFSKTGRKQKILSFALIHPCSNFIFLSKDEKLIWLRSNVAKRLV